MGQLGKKDRYRYSQKLNCWQMQELFLCAKMKEMMMKMINWIDQMVYKIAQVTDREIHVWRWVVVLMMKETRRGLEVRGCRNRSMEK